MVSICPAWSTGWLIASPISPPIGSLSAVTIETSSPWLTRSK